MFTRSALVAPSARKWGWAAKAEQLANPPGHLLSRRIDGRWKLRRPMSGGAFGFTLPYNAKRGGSNVLEIVAIRALPSHRLWLRYKDGAEGEVDLSPIVGKGVFRALEDQRVFETVRVTEGRWVTWGEDMELCADALYMELTGKTPDSVFPRLKTSDVDA